MATLGSRNSNNVEGRGWNERRMSNVGNNRGNWRNSEVVHRPNNGRNDYRRSNQNNRQKLVMVSDGTEFAVEDIERLFEEARRNTETKHEN
ncbi:hypothetical protein TNCV_3745891 [Trichonephila clavipes]|nr:hypothetical protein TNCV_3745891 [Trichonephila clavipes]